MPGQDDMLNVTVQALAAIVLQKYCKITSQEYFLFKRLVVKSFFFFFFLF